MVSRLGQVGRGPAPGAGRVLCHWARADCIWRHLDTGVIFDAKKVAGRLG